MDPTGVVALIVDDDEDMRVTLSDFVGGMGVRVSSAADTSEAIRLLHTQSPPFDLVLADLKLPGGTGLDILRAAHSRSAETLVTIVTGYASLETAIEAIRLGAYDYITKPFSLDEIGVLVRNMIDRIALANENARLSLRLQELLEQLNRIQSERLEFSGFQEEIRRGLLETSGKLDRLLAAATIACPIATSPAQGPDIARPRLAASSSKKSG